MIERNNTGILPCAVLIINNEHVIRLDLSEGQVIKINGTQAAGFGLENSYLHCVFSWLAANVIFKLNLEVLFHCSIVALLNYPIVPIMRQPTMKQFNNERF